MTKTILEQFREEFKCIQGDCDGNGHCPVQISEDEVEDNQCQFHAEYLFPLERFLTSIKEQMIEAVGEDMKHNSTDMASKYYWEKEGYNTAKAEIRQAIISKFGE